VRENAAAKGRRILGEGRLTISAVDDDTILARCKGDGIVHRLGWDASRGWWCSCAVVTTNCSHLLALRSVCVITKENR
jgi:hypothetical protein